MALARDVSSRTAHDTPHRRAVLVREALVRDGLLAAAPNQTADSEPESIQVTAQWRVAPDPFLISNEQLAFLKSLGPTLLAFYSAVNRLYGESLRGLQPAWVAAYLDQGKPESLIGFSRMKRFRDQLPTVIRPDIIPTETGFVITELDAVPGGIGLTGSLGHAYAAVGIEGREIIGGAHGMVDGFSRMLRALEDHTGDHASPSAGVNAIVVSEESKDYRPEMQWLAARLREGGLESYCVEPRDIRFTEEELRLQTARGERSVTVLYRFFELFDLKNIPKMDLIMYSAKKAQVSVTPPFKPQLEEKLAFALFYHPVLTAFWRRHLGDEHYHVLSAIIPRTWILDPHPIPPSAIIPGLVLNGRPVADWHALEAASQKDRQYVIKPSGFSELAWGSRGVSIGHDLSQKEWTAALENGMAAFEATPYVLQEFHKGRQFTVSYHDERSDEIVSMAGRTRLSPYYFVTENQAELGGVLATICPPDKKIIHGMREAIMVPCAVKTSDAS